MAIDPQPGAPPPRRGSAAGALLFLVGLLVLLAVFVVLFGISPLALACSSLPFLC